MMNMIGFLMGLAGSLLIICGFLVYQGDEKSKKETSTKPKTELQHHGYKYLGVGFYSYWKQNQDGTIVVDIYDKYGTLLVSDINELVTENDPQTHANIVSFQPKPQEKIEPIVPEHYPEHIEKLVRDPNSKIERLYEHKDLGHILVIRNGDDVTLYSEYLLHSSTYSYRPPFKLPSWAMPEFEYVRYNFSRPPFFKLYIYVEEGNIFFNYEEPQVETKSFEINYKAKKQL